MTSSSYIVFGGVGVLIVMIVLIGVLASRDYRAVASEAWVRRVQVALTTEMQGDVRLESLGEKVLRTLSSNLAAPVGAVYAVDGAQLRRIAGIALAPDAAITKKVGEGLGGEAARGGVAVHMENLPDDYLRISSALGDGRPRALAIAPAAVDGQVVAVTECSRSCARSTRSRSVRSIGCGGDRRRAAVRSNGQLEELLEESQRQAEELQTQQEELRVANEELEQQSRALRTRSAAREAGGARADQRAARGAERRARASATISRGRRRSSSARASTSPSSSRTCRTSCARRSTAR